MLYPRQPVWVLLIHALFPASLIQQQATIQVKYVVNTKSVRFHIFPATEIQNIQIAEGDVARNFSLPLYMVFPRLFTAPTLATNNFKIGKQVVKLILVLIFCEGIHPDEIQLTIVKVIKFAYQGYVRFLCLKFSTNYQDTLDEQFFATSQHSTVEIVVSNQILVQFHVNVLVFI